MRSARRKSTARLAMVEKTKWEWCGFNAVIAKAAPTCSPLQDKGPVRSIGARRHVYRFFAGLRGMTVFAYLSLYLYTRNQAIKGPRDQVTDGSHRTSFHTCDKTGASRGKPRPRAIMTSWSSGKIVHPFFHSSKTSSKSCFFLFRSKGAEI